MAFSIDTPITMIIARTLILYIALLFIFRLMGKREIATLNVLDLIVFMLMSELIAISIENFEVTVFEALLPVVALGAIQRVISYLSYRYQKFQRTAEGTPSVLVRNGKFEMGELKKTNYSIQDILMEIRLFGYGDLRDVDVVLLETNGKVSVFPYFRDGSSNFTLPLIVGGKVQYQNLHMLEIQPQWVIQKMQEEGYKTVEDILFCSYREQTFYIIPIEKQ